MQTPPLKLKPLFKERIWGSDRLARVLGKSLPEGSPIGESWEIADLPEGQSTIANGPAAGMTLRELLSRHGRELGLSDGQVQPPFGLLIKYLDAADTLSVQVHPDEAACERLGRGRPKTECWYVLDAEPGATIYRGLKPEVTPADMRAALADGSLEQLLVTHPARRGDFHFLPAGVVHALGAGLLVAEVQIPSDTTYRLFDWNRVDARGRARELHVEQAIESSHFGPEPAMDLPGEDTVGLEAFGRHLGMVRPLVHCDYFSAVHLTLPAGARQCEVDRPSVFMWIAGGGEMRTEAGRAAARTGETILVPAGPALRVENEQTSECLLVRLGPRQVR